MSIVFSICFCSAVCHAYEGKIDTVIGNDGTDYEVYYFNPKKMNTPFIYHSHKMRSARMIKVFILAEAMEQVKAGKLSLDDTILLRDEDKVGGSGVLIGYEDNTRLSVDTILRLMIVESDNTATNLMIDYLGFDAINDYITRNGYSDSLLQRKMTGTVL